MTWAKGQLEGFAKQYQLENYTLNARNDLFEQEGISRFVKEVKADMIVMATHGRRGLTPSFRQYCRRHGKPYTMPGMDL